MRERCTRKRQNADDCYARIVSRKARRTAKRMTVANVFRVNCVAGRRGANAVCGASGDSYASSEVAGKRSASVLTGDLQAAVAVIFAAVKYDNVRNDIVKIAVFFQRIAMFGTA